MNRVELLKILTKQNKTKQQIRYPLSIIAAQLIGRSHRLELFWRLLWKTIFRKRNRGWRSIIKVESDPLERRSLLEWLMRCQVVRHRMKCFDWTGVNDASMVGECNNNKHTSQSLIPIPVNLPSTSNLEASNSIATTISTPYYGYLVRLSSTHSCTQNSEGGMRVKFHPFLGRTEV